MLVAKGITKFWKNHPNKDKVNFQTFRQRIERRGLSFEEAMSLNPTRKEHKKQNSLSQFYENHPNKKFISKAGFYKRVRNRTTPEEAMEKPSSKFYNQQNLQT